ncbi:putative ATP-grasp-modified RiPP [Kribbella sp. NPDC058245]|uniref:putative ATP-grasp-modified RiPP n=1 Tax=Kribbella sp. NPDC058245 TaxID=3346399 RepID=UPI0036EA7A23
MTHDLTAVPFGVRHLASGPDAAPMELPMSYSANLQLNVSATGNPYHAIAAALPETNTETPIPDGQRPGSDNSTDNY